MDNKYKLASLMRYGINSAIRIKENSPKNDEDKLKLQDSYNEISQLATSININELQHFIILIKKEIQRLETFKQNIETIYNDDCTKDDENIFITHVLQDINYHYKNISPLLTNMLTFFKEVLNILENQYSILKEKNILINTIKIIQNLINQLRNGDTLENTLEEQETLKLLIEKLSDKELETLMILISNIKDNIKTINISENSMYNLFTNPDIPLSIRDVIQNDENDIVTKMSISSNIYELCNSIYDLIVKRKPEVTKLTLNNF